VNTKWISEQRAIFNLIADMDQLKVQVQPHKINGCRFGSSEGSGSTTQNGSVIKQNGSVNKGPSLI